MTDDAFPIISVDDIEAVRDLYAQLGVRGAVLVPATFVIVTNRTGRAAVTDGAWHLPYS
jgi:hypothetical protein